MYTIADYLDDYEAATQASPFYNEIKFEVIVYDECSGDYIEGIIWGESYEDVVYDVNGLLTDCQVVDEIINVF